jgi:hypothetical protein
VQNRAILLIAFGGALIAGHPSLAQTPDPDQAVVCAKPASGVGGPFAPNKDVAEAIFRAYAAAVWPDLLKKYPIVTVEDAGGHWTVTQSRTEKIHPIEQEHVTVVGRDGRTYGVTANKIDADGGQLSLEIDKCTAAISNATQGE